MSARDPIHPHLPLRPGARSWYYAKQAEGVLVPLAATKCESFLFEGGVWPGPILDGFVYLATIVLEMQDRKPVQIVDEAYLKLRVLDDGRLDDAHRSEGARTAMNLVWQKALPSEDADRFAERRLRAHYRWQPSPLDVDALVALLVRRGVPDRR